MSSSEKKSDTSPPPSAAPTSPQPVSGLRIYSHLLMLVAGIGGLLWMKNNPTQFGRGPLTIPEGFANCHPSHFRDVPDLTGTKLLSLDVRPIVGHSLDYAGLRSGKLFDNEPYHTPDTSNLTFCSVKYSYTHVMYGNRVNVTVYLPTADTWNGRFQGAGGGGYAATLGDVSLLPAVANGWAVAATDGGLFEKDDPRTGDINVWAEKDGNLNFNNLHVFGIRGISDMTQIGQAITNRYYDTKSTGRKVFSYWNGCSTGGRQGLMLAQRAPELYDGILTSAPAADYSHLLLATSYGQQIMHSANTFVQPCEIEYITAQAIEACDALDGVKDGLISSPELCKFDPLTLTGKSITCKDAPSGKATLSRFAADLVIRIWRGPQLPGSQDNARHPGLHQEAPLSALAKTVCNYTSNPPTCVGAPSVLSAMYLRLVLASNRNLDPLLPGPPPSDTYLMNPSVLFNLTDAQFHALLPIALRDLSPLIAAYDPDLSRFATAGQRPKMITWHGLADEVVSPAHSLNYYKIALEHFEKNKARYMPLAEGEKHSKVQDFYRYYQAPGVDHCGAGVGPYPGMMLDSAGALDQLVQWVEMGEVPEVLDAVSNRRGDLKDKKGKKGEMGPDWDGRLRRPLCTWPKKAVFKGKGRKGKEGQWWENEGWECVEQ